jgi:hypothetical protein
MELRQDMRYLFLLVVFSGFEGFDLYRLAEERVHTPCEGFSRHTSCHKFKQGVNGKDTANFYQNRSFYILLVRSSLEGMKFAGMCG